MPRVFVIYATKDSSFYDRLAEQARSARLAVEFERMQSKLPWVPEWKAQSRAKIYRCDAAIVLLSKNIAEGGLAWELQCAREFDIPMLGVHLDKFDKAPPPKELEDSTVIEWNWPAIARFLQSLSKGSSAAV